MCLDCLESIFVTFKPPASGSRAYSDCYPIRVFETFDLRHLQGTNQQNIGYFSISGVVIGSALSKGSRTVPEAFRAGHFEDSKPVTAHEKPLASRVNKVPPRFELGSLDSESRVLTITPWDLK